jgi:hypothetical protein
LNYNWRTKATTDDLHHHRSIQVKTDDHTLYGNKGTLRKNKKSGHHFIYLENYVIQRRMIKQSGFNAELIEKDKYPESKTV